MALRQLMRPTSSRQERLLEREKVVETSTATGSNGLSPSSPFYIPELQGGPPCPLPSEDAAIGAAGEEEQRDPRLYMALKEMMRLYDLSQHDVCLSSNLSGGQAALSSLLNNRKIANVARKQDQLRRWLWKFEQFQKLRAEHAIANSLPRPATSSCQGLVPPLLHPNGAPLTVGSTAAGLPVNWPPVITWKSYFDPLTPEEELAIKEAQEEETRQRAAAQAAAQAGTKRTSTGKARTSLSNSAPLTNGAGGSGSLSNSAPAGLNGDGMQMSRLRTVHHAPHKFGDEEESEAAAAAGGTRSARSSLGGAAAGSSSELDDDPASARKQPRSKRKDPQLPASMDAHPTLATGAHPESFSHRYNIGDKLDCRVTPAGDSAWLGAVVRDVRSCAIRLHFVKTSDSWDQWVNTRSKRLGEFGVLSKRNADAAELDALAKAAYKEYVKAERESAKDGYTGGAPLWSGKKRTDLANGGVSARTAAARKKASAARASSDDGDEPINTNLDECGKCGKGGNLLCCDGCPRSFHGRCCDPEVDVKALVASGDPWFCAKCANKRRKLA